MQYKKLNINKKDLKEEVTDIFWCIFQIKKDRDYNWKEGRFIHCYMFPSLFIPCKSNDRLVYLLNRRIFKKVVKFLITNNLCEDRKDLYSSDMHDFRIMNTNISIKDITRGLINKVKKR